jgi:signal transduction histidine kinase
VGLTDEAVRIAVLFVGWPGMALVSAFVLWSTFRFHAKVQGSAVGRLVLLMVVGWVVTMGVLAYLATLYLQADPEGAGPVTSAFLVFWAGSMAMIVWLVHRWGAEAVHINLYYAELAAMDHIKTQLINTVAHELNTPLTPILLKFDLLAKGRFGEITPQQAEVLTSIERNLNRLQVLVAQVVLATRLQAGQLPIVPLPIPVADWVRGVTDRFQAQAKDEGRRLEVRVETDAVAHLDRGHMDRVLAALVDNAFRFSGKGDAVEVVARLDGAQLVVDVRDAGRGFTVEQREALFQPFRHAHDPKQETRAGAGLGLFVAQSLVRAHGGRIEAMSPGPGQGATFSIRVPLRAELKSTAPGPASAA